ncbi:MAG: immunoglobulin domain-containing protein [Bacteroidia bacterium]|nr:immunoglobulin domain-containing protein [Bacteroidia bacterium]
MTVVGGDFTLAGGLPASNLAYWNGSVWVPIGTGCNGTIRTLELFDQYLYVGGDFTSIGGISANHIARFNGLVWEALGAGTDGPVNVIHHGSFLYAGGSFANAGGVSANNIASWNGTSWSAIGNGFDGPVYSILGIGTTITAAGSFINSGSTNVNNIAKWNGGSWIPFATGANNTIYSIEQVGSSIFACGSFTSAGAVSANNIAEWDGTNWLTLGNGLNNKGYCISSSGNDLVCGGLFSTAGINTSFYFGKYYSPPVIINQPGSYTKCFGDTLMLNVTVSSGLPLMYQWEKDGVPVGINNDTLLISSVISADAGIYTCVISNSVGTVSILPITVEVYSSPVFTTLIQDSAICVGSDISITAIVSGTLPIFYQWYKNSSSILSETNNTININNADISNGGSYFCVSQNVCGIDTTNTFVVTINTLPVTAFTGLSTDYCINGLNDTLQGTPAGGVFSGSGISGDVFSPVGLVGNHAITYTYIDVNGCTGVSTQMATVHTLTFVTFTGLNSEYCYNSIPDTLLASPMGGVFSGIGMSNNVFYASNVPFGNNAVYYSYTDINGCTNTKSQSTYIYGQTAFTYPALDTSFCENDLSDIVRVFPFGGYFTGVGMTDSTFIPQNAGVGSHNIFYHYTDGHSCLNIDSMTFIVHSLPVVNITDISTEYCKNAIPDILAGSPTGGTFTGSGIINNILDPNLLIPGTYSAYYTFTDSFGCANSDTAIFNIVNAITVLFSGISTFYCPYDSPDVMTGIPAGGIFSGPGVTGNTFSPSIAGSGIQTIVYSYDNLNGCFSYDSVDVTVDVLPNVIILPVSNICVGDDITLTAVSDAGTCVWNTLDTTHSIIVNPSITTDYSIVLYGLTCINSDTVTVTVNPLPVLNLGPDTSGCAPYIINAPGNLLSYNWSNGSTDSITTVNTTGNYSLTVTNNFNCNSTDEVFISVSPIPYFDLGNDLSISNTQTIIIGTTPSFSNYLWSTGSTQNFIVVNGQTAGFGVHNYSLTVYNDSGCSYTDSVAVNITNLGICDNYETTICSVFPNPASEYVKLLIPDNYKKLVCIDITTENGKRISELKKADIAGNEIIIDLSEFARGIYFVNFKSETEVISRKLIVN